MELRLVAKFWAGWHPKLARLNMQQIGALWHQNIRDSPPLTGATSMDRSL